MFPFVAGALAQDDAVFGKMAAKCVDQLSALTHEQVAGAEEHHPELLRGRLAEHLMRLDFVSHIHGHQRSAGPLRHLSTAHTVRPKGTPKTGKAPEPGFTLYLRNRPAREDTASDAVSAARRPRLLRP